MTDPNYTHLAFLLDSSGSMHSIKSDVEGGFNAFITEQRSEPGRCTVSLSDFSGYSHHGHFAGGLLTTANPVGQHLVEPQLDYRQLYVGKDISEVPELMISPRGNTALLDSIARMITETGSWLAAMPEDQRPGLVIFGIMTDGYENASREMNHAAIKALINEQETKYNWVFNYLGANQDAIEEGAKMGIGADMAATYSGGNAKGAMTAVSASVAGMRTASSLGASYHSVRAAGAYDEGTRESLLKGDPEAK